MRFLRFFFHQLYHTFAWGYDLVAAIVSGGRWKKWITSVIPSIQGKTVLELGIGTGTLQQALAGSGFQTIGVDESRQMLRIAKKRTATYRFHSQLIRARAEALPLPAKSMDTIVATFPSEYIFQPETMQTCRRILRPGGRLVVLLGVQVGGDGIINHLLRILYQVTGQGTPDLKALDKSLTGLATFGFTARVENLVYQKDTLTILIAA